jgi:hypothetical protein
MNPSIAVAAPAAAGRVRALGFIVLAGLVAASCDITYALVYYPLRGVAPMRVLQSVASGLLGKGSFEGGAPTAALGLALHYGICIVAASVFWLAARRLGWLVQRPVLAGLLFGLAVYGFMNFVVLPLSAVPFKWRFVPLTVGTGLLVHMFGVGLPIALLTRRGRRA